MEIRCLKDFVDGSDFFTKLVHGFGHPWSTPQSTQKLHRMLSYFADYEYILQRLCWVGWRAENQWLSTKYLSIQSGFWEVWGVTIMCLNSQQCVVKNWNQQPIFLRYLMELCIKQWACFSTIRIFSQIPSNIRRSDFSTRF